MAIATSKTIIRAVVPKTVALTIDRMAKASGKSRSAVVAGFLIEVEPALKRLAGMLEVAKAQQSLFPNSAVAELEAALDDLSGNAVEVLDKVDRALQLPLEAPATGKKARLQKRASRARNARRPARRTPV